MSVPDQSRTGGRDRHRGGLRRPLGSQKTRDRIALATVLSALIVAGLIVLFFRTGKDEAPPVAASGAASTPAVQSSPSSSADFPSTAADCRSTLGASVRLDAKKTEFTSCGLLRRLGVATTDYVKAHPDESSFTVDGVTSPVNRERQYSATCKRANHLSTCSGSGHQAVYTYYVKDPAGS